MLRLLTYIVLLFAAQDDTVFRSNVSLVRLDVEVEDSSGNIVTGLKQDDFVIRDNGVKQTPVDFGFEKEPLDLILLFDTGGSMKPKVHQILRAVELGFHELQPGDRVCVMAFASFTSEIAPFTADLDQVNSSILLKVLTLRFTGASNAVLAAGEAAKRFLREPVSARRRAVLVISDKISSDASSAPKLWQADAVLGELVLDKTGTRRSNPLADRTGGATIIAGDPGPAFQESLRRLRRRYTLHYPLPDSAAGTERSIEVQLAAGALKRYPGASIHARTGYVVRLTSK